MTKRSGELCEIGCGVCVEVDELSLSQEVGKQEVGGSGLTRKNHNHTIIKLLILLAAHWRKFWAC